MESYFHSPMQGCKFKKDFKPVTGSSKRKPKFLYFKRCLVHGEIEVCRCGYEFGKHPVSQ